MKNKMGDVRDHLVAMLEQLGDPDVKAEVIERAKASALVADRYIASVKVEIDALRVADEIGCIPSVLEGPPALEQDDDPSAAARPRAIPFMRRHRLPR